MLCLPCPPCFPRKAYRPIDSSEAPRVPAPPLGIGVHVQISGLKSRPEFNGSTALVTGKDEALNRWNCKVLEGEATGKYVKCKADNLTVFDAGNQELAKTILKGSSAEVPAWLKEGVPRQLRIAPGMRVPVCASPAGKELFVMGKAGSLLITTGRREGEWIERATLLGHTGWVSCQTRSGESMLLPDLSYGRHGDDLESRGHQRLLLQEHGSALLRLHFAPSAQRKPLSFQEVAPKKLQVRQGRHSAYLLTPDDSGLDKRPLLVVLHGGSKGRAYQFDDLVSGFAEVAIKNQSFVLLPEALGHTWDFMTTGQREDVDWVGCVLDEVRNGYPVDQKRIAVMGSSDGGSMALSLGLCNPTIFETAMSQAAGFYHDPGTVRDDLTKPRIFLAHGIRDEVFRFDLALELWDRLKYQGYNVEFRALTKFPRYSHAGSCSNPAEAIEHWLSLPLRGPSDDKIVYDSVWSLSHVLEVGCNDHKEAGVLEVLDEGVFPSLAQAVQALDSGTINCKRPYCLVRPADSDEQVLVYRSDKKRDALLAFFRSDQFLLQNNL